MMWTSVADNVLSKISAEPILNILDGVEAVGTCYLSFRVEVALRVVLLLLLSGVVNESGCIGEYGFFSHRSHFPSLHPCKALFFKCAGISVGSRDFM